MRPDLPQADRIRLLHMLEAAEQAGSFSVGRARHDLENDLMYRRAVLHCIQEIGEAATRITDETRSLAPQLPWRQIVGMRHRLVHVYFRIDLDLVWEVVERDLPSLVQSLRQVLTNPSVDA